MTSTSKPAAPAPEPGGGPPGRAAGTRRRSVRAGLTAAAATALLLAAAPAATAEDNGIADQSAQTIADRSRTAMADATSLRMAAELTDSTGTTGLDLAFDTQGNCAGTVKLPGGEGRADVIKRGDDVWMKLDETLLRSQIPGSAADDAIALIDGRYLHGTTNSAVLKQFAEFCDLNQFKEKFSSAPAGEKLTKGQRTTVDGDPAVTVTSRHGTETTTFYVSTEDAPYLLRAEGTDSGGERTEAVFSDYGRPVPARTPAPADSVDLSELQ
ncbi:hypothetical protein [Streptomyces sp. NPDC097619]|uniref:hypothetical protein n=1 Tax=Streptomyces sp. NPDC097619 TaxID=3157228 RepID=UPI003327DD4E